MNKLYTLILGFLTNPCELPRREMTKFIATLALFCTSICWGQMGTQLISSSYSSANVMGYCGGSISCWHQSWGHPEVFSKVYASNGKVLAINGSNEGYEWNGYPANTWTAHPEWGQVHSLQADSKGGIWALYDAGHCPTGQGWSLGEWNGGSFTEATYCYMKFALSQDGNDKPFGADINGTLWTSDSANGKRWWQHFPFQPGSVNSIAVIGLSQLYVTTTNGNILWFNNTNGTWTQLPGVASVGYGADVNLAIDNSADLYVIGNGSSKSVYYYNGSGWSPLNQNGFTSIAVSNEMLIFGVGVTDSKNGISNNLYRFNPITFKHTRTFTLTGANCINCVHTQSVWANWKGASFGDDGQQVVYSPKGQTETVTSSRILADPFSCVEADPNCTPVQISHLLCTDAGTLNNLSQDDKPIIMTLGQYVDVENWTGFAGAAGPLNTGTANVGIWTGLVNMYITQLGGGCPPATSPTCQPEFNPSNMLDTCTYDNVIDNAACEGQVLNRMRDTTLGLDDPYVWTGSYAKVQYPDGNVDIRCVPATISPQSFLYKGAKGPTPPCS